MLLGFVVVVFGLLAIVFVLTSPRFHGWRQERRENRGGE